MQRDTSLCAIQLKCLGRDVLLPPIPNSVSCQQNCPVAGYDLFTSLLTLHTPFLKSWRSLSLSKHVIWSTDFLQRHFLSGEIILRHSWNVPLMTQVIQSLPSKMETMLWQQYTGGSPYQLICLQLCCYGNHSGSTSVVISGIKSIQKFSLYRMVLRHWW